VARLPLRNPLDSGGLNRDCIHNAERFSEGPNQWDGVSHNQFDLGEKTAPGIQMESSIRNVGSTALWREKRIKPLHVLDEFLMRSDAPSSPFDWPHGVSRSGK
jgi:hypothetical protein